MAEKSSFSAQSLVYVEVSMTSPIDRIRKSLSEVEHGIKSIKSSISTNPKEAWTLKLSLRSFQSQRTLLQQELEELCLAAGNEICSYRIVDCESLGIANLGLSLISFQDVFSIVYAAQHDGPRLSNRLSDEVANAKKLLFGYAFEGSVGISMFTPADFRLLESDIKYAAEFLFRLTTCKTVEEIHVFSKILGPAAMRSFYKWCKVNSDLNTGLEITWKAARQDVSRFEILRSTFHSLQKILDLVTEVTEERRTLSGTLVGADVQTKSFHFVCDTEGHIRGKMVQNDSLEINLPKRCKIEVIRFAEIRFASEKEVVTYHLVKLLEPGDSTR